MRGASPSLFFTLARAPLAYLSTPSQAVSHRVAPGRSGHNSPQASKWGNFFPKVKWEHSAPFFPKVRPLKTFFIRLEILFCQLQLSPRVVNKKSVSEKIFRGNLDCAHLVSPAARDCIGQSSPSLENRGIFSQKSTKRERIRNFPKTKCAELARLAKEAQ